MPKERQSALSKAMTYLAARPLTEMELFAKLRRAGYPDAECDNAVAECRKNRYIDDESFAADAIPLMRQRNIGTRQIRQKLARKGLDMELVSELLAGSEDEEIESARRAMEGKLRMLVKESDPRKKREKLFRFMTARGFSSDIVFQLIKEYL